MLAPPIVVGMCEGFPHLPIRTAQPWRGSTRFLEATHAALAELTFDQVSHFSFLFYLGFLYSISDS